MRQGNTYSLAIALPATGKAGTFYLIAHKHDDRDIYDEYVWLPASNNFNWQKTQSGIV